MGKEILFAGDANVDMLLFDLEDQVQKDREVFCGKCEYLLGGSSTLTAAAYAHLGGSCDFCGLIGDDYHGRFVQKELIDANVGVDLLRLSPGEETGLTVNIIEGRNRTQITHRGSLLHVDETETIIQNLSRYKHLHVTGIYGTKKFFPHIEQVLIEAKQRGVTTSLDTQWDATETWLFIDRWLPVVDYLIVNEDESISIARRLGLSVNETSSIEEVWTFLNKKTACPIIKLGKKGAYARGVSYPPCDIENIVDTTGAGDSLAATFLYTKIVLGYDFDLAMKYAQAGGALACTFVGGYSPNFTFDTIESLVNLN